MCKEQDSSSQLQLPLSQEQTTETTVSFVPAVSPACAVVSAENEENLRVIEPWEVRKARILERRKSEYPGVFTLEEIHKRRDLDGDEPNIYMITTNRSAGKTTAILMEMLDAWNERGAESVLLFREQNELSGCADIFGDVIELYPEYISHLPGYKEEGDNISLFKMVSYQRGMFYQILIDGIPFAWALGMKKPDKLKKYSPLWRNVEIMFMDECQTESGEYLSSEPQKLLSILMCVARGGGKQSRDNIKVYLAGNNVSILNPYYVYFGITKRLKKGTRFMRGNGWVLQTDYIESSANAIAENKLYKAFRDDSYMSYAADNVFLNSDEMFIEKLSGQSIYLYTLVYGEVKLGVRRVPSEGIIHVSSSVDGSCKNIFAFRAKDLAYNQYLMDNYSFSWHILKDAYRAARLRFAGAVEKNIILELLGIDVLR